jgi:hypothetical protein
MNASNQQSSFDNELPPEIIEDEESGKQREDSFEERRKRKNLRGEARRIADYEWKQKWQD